MRNAFRLLVLVVIAIPASVPAQKKDDLLQIQRDVADLEDQVKKLQRSQDEKIAALTALAQQAVDASTKVSAGMVTLQRDLAETMNKNMADQQKQLVAPVAGLNSKIEELSNNVYSLSQALDQMVKRMDRMDTKLTDIYTAVTTPPVQAPPPVAQAPQNTANSIPPGLTALGLRQDGERDFSGARYEMALDEFAKYIQYFPGDEYAPVAQYHIGEIYDRVKMYDSAAKAFDAVVEKFPKNEKTVDAAYMKAVMLQKGDLKAEAKEEYQSFLSTYPPNEHTAAARAHLKELSPAASPTRSAGKKKQ